MRVYGRVTGETLCSFLFEPALLLEADSPRGAPVEVDRSAARLRRRYRDGLDALEVSTWPPRAGRKRQMPLPTMEDLAGEFRGPRRRRNRSKTMIVMAPPPAVAPAKDLTVGDIARRLRVAPRTVSKWIDSGLLRGYRLPGTAGHRRVRPIDLARFCKEHGLG
jgi:excisionase family DNA binding protein